MKKRDHKNHTLMNIREAKLSDAHALSRLALSLGAFYNDDDPSGISPYFAQKISPEGFKKYLSNEEAYEHYVYEEAEKIVGYFALLNETHFLYLLVDKAYHKKGIATTLIEHALKGKEHKLYTVNASLYAVPFYKKLGFVPSALVQKHYGMTYQPMVWDRVIKKEKVSN
jgi:GNAT superfamily N-acetyltransferase